ncbi:MAG: hypothetical protein ACM3ZQ_10520 [Bacillota bacterium]
MSIIIGSLVVLVSGFIFASSLPITLVPGLWGNLATLSALAGLILVFCLRDILARRRAIRGIMKLCTILCLPAILASSEMDWLHNLAELGLMTWRVRLDSGVLAVLLTVVIAGCIWLQVLARQRDLQRELLLREADADATGPAFAWQMGAVPIMLALTGLLMTVFIVGQNFAPIKRFAGMVAGRLPPALTVLTGVALVGLIVGAYLVETN